MFVEKWDVLDEYGHRTGRTVLRGQGKLKPGEYHLVVHIWIVSDNGKFLLQRRADDKKLVPGEWAATGGAAISGEDSATAAKRELFEELGITAEENNFIKLCRFKRRNSLLDVWIATFNSNPSDLKLQESEVAEVKWVTPTELLAMIENGEFHNYGSEYFDTLFEEIDNYRGAFV